MTKLIGVLGGTSWPSTPSVYRLLNEEVQKRLGGHHSARILLYSIDYDAIKSRYSGRCDEIPALLKAEVERLLQCRPDCYMIANNTLHKAWNAVADELPKAAPFFHAVRLTTDELTARGAKRVLLLGTRFTMEDGFFAAPIEAAGIRVDIPDEEDRARVQAMQSRIAAGEVDESFGPAFAELLAKYEAQGCEAVILACTELPMVIDQSMTGMRVIDPLVLQCRACVDYALS